MPKHGKKQEPKVIQLKDYQEKHAGWQEPQALYEYEDSASEDGLQPPTPEEKAKRERRAIPKAVYTVCLALVAVIIGLGLWINREFLSWDNLREWAKLQVLGEEGGDGFPVDITGSTVYDSNFLAYNGAAVMLSDTALSMVGAQGEEALSLRHDLNQPVLKAASGHFLMYNNGSTGYTLLAGTQVTASGVAEQDIITGAVAANGRFALGLAGEYGASHLQVFLENAGLQYEYAFANDYITAIALNQDASWGAVCTARSDKGEMVSRLTVFDFAQPEPVVQYETRDNLLLAACWSENGVIYAVGDKALVSGRASEGNFTEYDYQGRQLTAFQLAANRAFLSISAYEHAGASTLMILNGGEPYGESNPLRVELDRRVESISVYGGTVALLAGGEAVFCDYSTGQELARADAGADAKSLALSNESHAYVLGVSEVRTIELR